MVIQEVVVVAVHPQPAAAVTEALSEPPLPPGVTDVGDTVKLQGTPA
jgi:hypothetical protein